MTAMIDEILRKYIVESAEKVSKTIPDDLGGMVLLWGKTDKRIEDVMLLSTPSPFSPDNGEDPATCSEFITAKSLADCMQKEPRLARIVNFAASEFAEYKHRIEDSENT